MIKVFKLNDQSTIIGKESRGFFDTKIIQPVELKEWQIEGTIIHSLTFIPFMPDFIKILNKDILYRYTLKGDFIDSYNEKFKKLETIKTERILH
jgi:hypothetical protein